jgi:hypothetical protein
MRTIQISDECFEKLKDQLTEEEQINYSGLNDLVGKKFFFRTVTYHLVGLVSKVMGSFLILENASWVADSGRFMNALKDGELNEVEPCGAAFINLSTVTDFFPWKHDLPKDQK